MLTCVGFYVDGAGAIGVGMSQINESTPMPELLIRDLQDLIER